MRRVVNEAKGGGIEENQNLIGTCPALQGKCQREEKSRGEEKKSDEWGKTLSGGGKGHCQRLGEKAIGVPLMGYLEGRKKRDSKERKDLGGLWGGKRGNFRQN